MEINKKRKKKGFTLVELLVVLGIIGIISAIAAPTVLSKIDDAKQKTDVANAAPIHSISRLKYISDKYQVVLTRYLSLI